MNGLLREHDPHTGALEQNYGRGWMTWLPLGCRVGTSIKLRSGCCSERYADDLTRRKLLSFSFGRESEREREERRRISAISFDLTHILSACVGVERSIVVAVAQISSPRLDAALAIVATVAQISSQRFDSGAGDYWHCSRISSQGLLAIIVDCFTCSLESCLDVNGTFDSTIGRREEEAYEPRYGPSSTQRRRNTGEAQPPWLSSLLEALQDSDPAIENDDLLVITGNGSVRMHQAALMEQMRQSVSSGLIGSLSTVKSRPSEDGKWPTQDRWLRLKRSAPSRGLPLLMSTTFRRTGTGRCL
ncbi:uncharacterized protein LOC9654841 [Selaginella moellendorffii]|uniref:uncharacterized protein LOC9654841 n=1 Tax=Selaginella moellendorffii TaxID=88036 RepID=UPI000D1CE25A|nr:uncharacterized protein LOC9654841 [Selaginella moellendorffii]|eukprot:XP_024524797.1 uncharacterized protein LOC9654841 [Selaginella moellendorffii]